MSARSAKGIALLGSGTDVGKTWVGVRLFEVLQRQIPELRGIKPFESGWNEASSDARAWQLAQQDSLTLEEICRWRLPRPVTPAEEFERLATTPTRDEVVAAVKQMSHGHPFLLETAGGVASPITSELDSASLAQVLQLPTLLITSNGLGTISQTATAFHYAASRDAPPLAVLINARPTDDDLSATSNAKWIRRQIDGPVFVYDGSFPEPLVNLLIASLHGPDSPSAS